MLLIGGSAGSFKVILGLLGVFPERLNKAVLIVVHRKKNYKSEIEKIFAPNTKLQVKELNDKEKIEQNIIYIVPSNYHTLVEDDCSFSLDVSEPVWYSKPSIDVSFESAADCYGSRCCAILLSGANPDGARGMRKLKAAGALTIVQEPADAEIPEMPASAIKLDNFHLVLTAAEIITLIRDLSADNAG